MNTEHLVCDLVVVGSGASGLTSALTAASLGLDVIVIEKEAQFWWYLGMVWRLDVDPP